MTEDCKSRKERHKALLEKCYEEKYAAIENDRGKFTWDGPSNWEIWCSEKPRILFLMKEARGDFEPSVPNQPHSNKNGWNLARWYYAIKEVYCKKQIIPFPNDDQLPKNGNNYAIIEVKKFDEHKGKSDKNEINKYAEKDRECLIEQIEIIKPCVIVCCGTAEAYDIIYKDTDEIKKAFIRSKSGDNKKLCWQIGKCVVIEFVHPATHPSYIKTATSKDRELFDTLVKLLVDGQVFEGIDGLE